MTTWPRSWKAEEKDSSKIIYGKSLTTNPYGNFGINQLSPVNTCYSSSFGILVKKETIFWECAKCGKFNHYKQTTCSNCDEKLDRC